MICRYLYFISIFFYFVYISEVVRVFYESATENHVKPAIQSWFKHAPDRLLTTTQLKKKKVSTANIDSNT